MRTQAVEEHLQNISFFSPVDLAGSSPRGESGSVPHPKLHGCCTSERSWTLDLLGRWELGHASGMHWGMGTAWAWVGSAPKTAYPSPNGTDGCHSKFHWQQSRDPCFWRLAMCTSVGKVWDEVCGCFASSLLAQRGGGCQSLETVKVRLWP